MRHNNFTAFDEFVVNANGATNQVTTSNELNARLGHFDQMAVMVVVDNIDMGGMGCSFNLQIQHSSDGRNWTNWNTGANPDINALGLATNANNIGYCSVPTGTQTTPLLAYVRFQMYFTSPAGTKNGHVRVTVTQRDQGS